jgi:lipoyl(octanoyl) transferase
MTLLKAIQATTLTRAPLLKISPKTGVAHSAAQTKAILSRREPNIKHTCSTISTPSTVEGFRVWRPGRLAYRDAQKYQENLVARRPLWPFDLLILLEHPPVITLGRNSSKKNLLCSPDSLQASGVDCVATRRGGDITMHGPGQMVGYPIVDLNHYHRDLHQFLRRLETVLIRTLADFGLIGEALPDLTGVWVDGRKIASIGIAVRRWISYHGFALNIDNDLSSFSAIVPCGLSGVTMTSMSNELGRPIDTNEVGESLIHHFGNILERPLLGNYDDESSTS